MFYLLDFADPAVAMKSSLDYAEIQVPIGLGSSGFPFRGSIQALERFKGCVGKKVMIDAEVSFARTGTRDRRVFMGAEAVQIYSIELVR